MNRVCEVLGIEKPVVQAPMLWLTSPTLVAAISEAGGLGVIGVGAGSTEPEGSREANAAGDLNPDQGDYRRSELLGELDEGINSANSVVSLVKSIDPCADIVAELARGYA